jgi:hypothetical protein
MTELSKKNINVMEKHIEDKSDGKRVAVTLNEHVVVEACGSDMQQLQEVLQQH